jgi:glycosidase
MILVGMIFAQETLHRFTFVAEQKLNSVSVAGTFNNWNKDANPMQISSDGRTWTTSIKLGLGKHQYKFIKNGDQWITDPKATKNEDDGGGNINSILFITPQDYKRKASRTDGQTAKSAIYHEPLAPYFNFYNGSVQLKLRSRPGDINSVKVVSGSVVTTAKETTIDEFYSNWKAELPWDGKSKLFYRFELTDGSTKSSYSYAVDPAKTAVFITPNWVPQTVVYQIFPDRFANGNRSNDPAEVMPWDAKPTYSNRYGGDVAGVSKHLKHLKDLGVGTVYFNPIFASPSNHRYEADDFYQPDKEFGTQSEFIALTKEMKASGIRTVMDFVFNHTSPNFFAFKDLAEKGQQSKYKDWYFPKSFPVVSGDSKTYEAWYGFPSMPKVNIVNPEARDWFLKMAQFWLKNSALDGMRLDVANEVNPEFWRTMRPIVKKANPNVWIIGEIWGDGSPWLKGDQFDSVMNYQFRDACLKFIAKGTTNSKQFANQLMKVHESYVPQVSNNMMNLLSSHDTARFLTEAGGDKDLQMLAAAVQFTWVGAPSVYYGEELGMEGGADPYNRRGMEWYKATATNNMLSHYKKLAALKKTNTALWTPNVEFLQVDGSESDRVGAYVRTSNKDAVLVAYNRSDAEQTISIRPPTGVRKLASGGLSDIISGDRVAVSDRPVIIKLRPRSARVLVPSAKKSSLAPKVQLFAASKGDSVQRRANSIQEQTQQP